MISGSAIFATSVLAADLDGDGDADVLSATYGDLKIAWYENVEGAGTFGPARVISTEAIGPWSVVAADIDGDGDRDVLSASAVGHEVAWYANLGGGTFGGQQVISTAARYARSVFSADVDGDGDRDVLSASWGDDKVGWHENLGAAGGFGIEREVSTGALGAESAVAADVDGDGVCGRVDNCPAVANPDQADGDVIWDTMLTQWGVAGQASSLFAGHSYATGPPVGGCADVGWMPLGGGRDVEWLELSYATPVQANRVQMYEAQVGGFVRSIELRDAGGVLHPALEIDDPTPCGEVLSVTLSPHPEPIVGVRVYTSVDGHEAIEAMPLMGTAAIAQPDGIGDACDSCPMEYYGVQTFGQTLLADGSGGFVWSFPVNVTWVRGELSSLSAYSVASSGTESNAKYLDTVADDPAAGEGFWYLVRPSGPCGSWQSEAKDRGSESGRDPSLP